MGRVTIFSLTECPHCQRTKAALTVREIPYTEINLSTHPSARTAMLQLADRLTVPQVFFNEKHIGGADDTVAVLEEWDKETNTSALEKYTAEIASQPDPTDSRLQVPNEPPVVESPPPERPDVKSITLPDTTAVTVLEITEQLKQILPDGQNLKHNLTIYKRSFTGRQAVLAFQKHFNNITKEDAVKFGRQLLKAGLICHVCDEHDFRDTESKYFRLQCHQTPDVLNSYRIWNERVDSNAMALVKRLKKLLGKVFTAVTDPATGNVDYKSAADLPEYAVFEEAVCELQNVDISAQDDTTRSAYAINVYNLMITYAFIKVGIGQTNLARSAFFGRTCLNLGGHLLSFSDLENGVLRSNSKPPYMFSLPFGRSDPRLPLAVANKDCRIHFALNCGAKSCPPIKHFSAESLGEELRIVASAFCEQDENVLVDSENHELHLSMILYWYRTDFATSNAELPTVIVQYLRGAKKEALQKMIDSGKPVTVKFLEYNWDTNASEFVPFESSILCPNESIIWKAFF